MAKKALVNKANKKPKFKVRGLHPLQQVRSPARRVPQVRPVPDLPARDGACRRTARRAEVQLVTAHPQKTNRPSREQVRSRPDPGTAARKVTGPVMTMTDPIADFLTRLRNANSAYHDEVTLPHSKIKANIAEILKKEGYITDFRTEDARVGKSLVVQLKYGPNRERSIAGLRRVSKPGLRVYAKSTNLPRVLGGLGVAIISTSSGLLTDRQAARQGVGGEVLAYVW